MSRSKSVTELSRYLETKEEKELFNELEKVILTWEHRSHGFTKTQQDLLLDLFVRYIKSAQVAYRERTQLVAENQALRNELEKSALLLGLKEIKNFSPLNKG